MQKTITLVTLLLTLASCGGSKNNTGISGQDYSLQRLGDLEIHYSENSKEIEEVRTLRGHNFSVIVQTMKENYFKEKMQDAKNKILDIQKNNELSVSIVQTDVTDKKIFPTFSSHQVNPNEIILNYKNNEDYSNSVVFCNKSENKNWNYLPATFSFAISNSNLNIQDNQFTHQFKMHICQKNIYQKLEFKNEEIKNLSDDEFLAKLSKSKIELSPIEKNEILKQRKEKIFTSFNRYTLQNLNTSFNYSNIINFEMRDIEVKFRSLKNDHQLTNGQYEIIDMKKIWARTEAKEDVRHITVIIKEKVEPDCNQKRISREGGEGDLPCPKPYFKDIDVGPNVITQYREVHYFPLELTSTEKEQITNSLFGSQEVNEIMYLNTANIQNFSAVASTKEEYIKRVITRERNGSISNQEESKILLELNPYYSIKVRKFYDQANLKETRLEMFF